MTGKPAAKSITSTRAPEPAKTSGPAQVHKLDVTAVKNMFHERHHRNVDSGYSAIEREIAVHLDRHKSKINLTEAQKQNLRLYLYATVAAETGDFVPRDEKPNPSNTMPIPRDYIGSSDSVQTAFNKYAFKNGNNSQADAERFRGRGYVQITGKSNYAFYGASAGIPDLLVRPEKASSPDNAAKLIVAYVMDEKNRHRIIKALDSGDMIDARAVVNGGNHYHKPNGLKAFKDAYVKGLEAIDPNLKTRTLQSLQKDGSEA